MKDGIWYQVINQNERIRIIKEVFGIDAEPWPPLVLEDSPEYLEEQERLRLEEEQERLRLEEALGEGGQPEELPETDEQHDEEDPEEE